MKRLGWLQVLVMSFVCLAGSACSRVDYDNPSLEDVPILVKQYWISDDSSTYLAARDALPIVCAMEGGVDAILDLVEDEDPQMRADAIKVLSHMAMGGHIQIEDHPEFLPTILEAFEDSDIMVRVEASLAISNCAMNVRIYPSAGSPIELDSPQRGFIDAIPQVVPVLIEALDSSDEFVRHTVKSTLSRLGPYAIEAIPALTDGLNHPDLEARTYCAVALARISPDMPRALPVLAEAIQNGDAGLSDDAGEAICMLRLETVDVLPILVRLMESSNPNLRTCAGEKIGLIGTGDGSVVTELIGLLEHDDPGVRADAAWTLGLLGPAVVEALPALRGVLADGFEMVEEVREAARRAIQEIEASDHGVNHDGSGGGEGPAPG